MASVQGERGIVIDFDERWYSVRTGAAAAPPATGRAQSKGRFSERPRPASTGAGDDSNSGAAALLARRLLATGTVDAVTAPVRLGPGSRSAGTRSAAAATPPRMTVPLADGQDAVVLLEGDGVLAWHYGSGAPASAFAPGLRSRSGGARSKVFELRLPPPASAATRGAVTRGEVLDWLWEPAKAVVLYFSADAVAAGAVHLLERKRRTGPVWIHRAEGAAPDAPPQWQPLDSWAGLSLPADRPARLLLLVHGTFSSTLGGFGELAATPWGQRLLDGALQRYDAVLGFDHRTLSQSVGDNAAQLLQALRQLPAAQPLHIDAICHSRGGMVLRALTEVLQPAAVPWRFERVVFVGATNAGTELARPENWHSLVDLLTNLASATCTVLSWFPATAAGAAVADEVVGALGDFVKYLVQVAVSERQVPGIADMDPAGAFVRQLNAPQAAAFDASYAIVSDFEARVRDSGEHEPGELPKRLALLLANGVVDQLMRRSSGQRVPNDLVVDVASMTDIDRGQGPPLADVLNFGRNPLVYHTNYFLRPETARSLAQWLQLPPPLQGIDTDALAGVRRSVAPLRSGATVAEVRALLAQGRPDYLLLSKPEPGATDGQRMRYALTPAEFEAGTALADARSVATEAMGLHETDQSATGSRAALAFEPPPGLRGAPGIAPSHQRSVLLDASGAVGVRDADHSGPADMRALARLAQRLQAQPDLAARKHATAPVLIDGEPAALWVHRGGLGAALSGTKPPASFDWREDLQAEAGPTSKGAPFAAHIRRAEPRKPRAGSPASSPPKVVPAPAAAEIHATAEMPRSTPLGGTAWLSLSLGSQAIAAAAGHAAASGRFQAAPGIGLTVLLFGLEGFSLVDDPAQPQRVGLAVPAPGEVLMAEFQLRASQVGPARATLLVRQGAQRRLLLTVECEVLPQGATARPGRATAASVAADEPLDRVPVPTLDILVQEGAGPSTLKYLLRAGPLDDSFESPELKRKTQVYIEARYADIEDAWRGSQRAAKRFTARLQSTGGEMFRSLFPLPMRQALWKLLQGGDLDGLQINTDDPFLPWELVFIDNPDAPAATGQGRFLGELGLCRWISGAGRVTRIRVRSGRARYVIPHYVDPRWHLKAAVEEEEPMLQRQLGWHLKAAVEEEEPMLQRQLGALPVPPHHGDVLGLLKQPGSFDLLHFACHGEAPLADANAAALLLQGEVFATADGPLWCDDLLRAQEVQEYANLRGPDGNRPLVMLNACQAGRTGTALSGPGGFAPAFLGARPGSGDTRGRAGAFVGTLWKVDDEAASQFVAALYEELHAGRPMAQATRAARQRARDAGDASWLAYAVYAHPQLQLDFE